MRYNRFNEAYCTDVNDVQHELERREFNPAMVYAAEIPSTKGETPAMEVMENISGETLFYIEAPTLAACREIAQGCNIQLDV